MNLLISRIKKNSFKLAAFGTSVTALFGTEDVKAVCAKQIYHTIERVVEINGLLMKKVINISYDSQKQLQYLTIEILYLIWAQALLNIVYGFIKESGAIRSHLFHIP